MSKDAIMVAVDAGSSMDQPFSEHASRLKIALQCFKLTLQQKLFNNANHEIGFSLFGDNESDDGQNLLLQPIQKPNLQLVRKIVKMSDAKLDNQKKGGDIFSAIEFVINTIEEYCKNKKYNKRAFIFTNGMGQTKYTTRALEGLVSDLRKNFIKLNIIPLDFMENYDMEQNSLDGDSCCDPQQIQNANLLIQLRAIEPDNIQIFPASLAIQLYKKFRKRDVNPVALFRGNLQIAPGLNIQVATYKAVRREKLKSLSKYDLTKPFEPSVSNCKDITTEITYVIQGDVTGSLVDPQNRTNAYPYGPHFIPISQILQNGTKIYEEKNFKLLGFVDKQKIPRQCMLGEVDMVVPSEDPLSRKLFTSFVYSMISLNRYAVARYIPRNSVRGVSPKLVALIPFRSAQKQMFYLVQIPTAEDVRDYSFNSIKKSTQRQQEIVSELIEKMCLVRKNDDEEVQELKIDNTFNPLRQHFFQTIFHRALNDDGQIPDLDPAIKFYLKPQENKFKALDSLAKQLKKQFKLSVKQLARDKIKQKKALMFKDILIYDQKTNDESLISTQVDEKFFMEKKFNIDSYDEDYFDPKMPIVSFKRMINNRNKNLTQDALKSMRDYIQAKSKSATGQQSIDMLIECAQQLRNGCQIHGFSQFWDDWFENCNSVIGVIIYEKMKEEGLGFIKKSNNKVYKMEQLHILQSNIDDDLD